MAKLNQQVMCLRVLSTGPGYTWLEDEELANASNWYLPPAAGTLVLKQSEKAAGWQARKLCQLCVAVKQFR